MNILKIIKNYWEILEDKKVFFFTSNFIKHNIFNLRVCFNSNNNTFDRKIIEYSTISYKLF